MLWGTLWGKVCGPIVKECLFGFLGFVGFGVYGVGPNVGNFPREYTGGDAVDRVFPFLDRGVDEDAYDFFKGGSFEYAGLDLLEPVPGHGCQVSVLCHPVCQEQQVPYVEVDAVMCENFSYFYEDCDSGGFYAKQCPNGVDVVGVYGLEDFRVQPNEGKNVEGGFDQLPGVFAPLCAGHPDVLWDPIWDPIWDVAGVDV